METAELIEPGFTVADANRPDLTTTEGNLRIHFTQWNDEPTQVLFVDAIAHRWGEINWDGELEGEHFDGTHIIHQSKWMQSLFDCRECAPEAGYKHYRLNFNAAGSLEVIAREVTVEIGGDGTTEYSPG
ncbi:hypothetical protein DES53_101342 [Roseimicrobium gellanilyticum]|uniref:Uncharacterized protein n=1 Tax=Roseimicrobium gellanilyticum TaxID=748857 RepID=A0A366HVM7_9BACT|nr:hypothetical protein [Roseimicrobium gellanilyticum]RBP47545.1 hypothetical protein DES53_101342 [Roseimicrobium gellanilyticum]